MNGGQRNGTNAQIWGSKTTRIMMATVPHVTSGLGLRKFQADGFLLTRVYMYNPTGYNMKVFPFSRLSEMRVFPLHLFMLQCRQSQTTTVGSFLSVLITARKTQQHE